MSKERINVLLEKYIAGTIGDAEKQELSDLYQNIGSTPAEYPDERKRVSDRVLKRLENEIHHKKHRVVFRDLWRIAAAVAAIFICTTLYLINRPVENNKPLLAHQVTKEVISPGTNVAVLTLGNGKKILLNGSTNGTLAVQGNTTITKNTTGHISYKMTGNDAAGQDAPVTYNSIATPPGGQFRITLPDGSNVWLNAASSLRYPSRFDATGRHVELHGEAYFEIYKNKNAPFTVSADKVNIKVLGTHFNVMAYANESSINTTLLEGSISLSSEKVQQVLVPGQQAVAERASDKVTLNTVNVEDAVAWKNGYFSFRKENIRMVMNKIARWYNVDIEYRGSVNDKILGGTVSRAENITELLNYIELTGIAKFKIEGRRIIVICK